MLTFSLYTPDLRSAVTRQPSNGFNSVGQHERGPEAFSICDRFLQRLVAMYVLVPHQYREGHPV